MIKAIIFDFFGVIVGDGFDSTYRSAGGDPIKDKGFVQELLNSTNRGQITPEEFRQKICEKLGITVDTYQEAVTQAEQIDFELLDYIKKLRANYKTALLSNVNKGGLERRIKRETLDEYFDDIVVSGEVGYIKPELEIYQLAAKRLGVELRECIFTDDRGPYVEAAEMIGMKGIVYKEFNQFKQELEGLLATSSDN
jgi:putative hydrolase of the HAD superfamily